MSIEGALKPAGTSMEDVQKRKSYILFLVFIMFSIIFFRNPISVVFGEAIANLSLLLLFSLAPYFLLVPFNRRFGLLLIMYAAYLTGHLMIGLSQGFFYSLVGFFNLLGPLFFMVTVYLASPNKSRVFNLSISLIIAFSVINAVGALIQTKLSIDIFGLISNDVYANEELMSGGGIQKRAISFITSPQSLSLTLAFATVLIVYCWPRQWSLFLKLTSLGLVGFSGLLTISKAYFVFLVVAFALMSVKRFSHLILFGIVVLVVGATSQFDRLFLIFDYFANFTSYPAYEHWMRGFQDIDSAATLLFGKGIGFYSRGGQIISGSDSIIGVESFVIQVFAETGLVGLILFISLFSLSLFFLMRSNKILLVALIALFVVGLFTPAPYGFVVGLQLYFVMATGFFADKINFSKCGIVK